MRYRWRVFLISFIAGLLVVSPVLAHANLARSSPAANASLQSSPDEIRLWFTETLEPNYSHFTLRDTSGQLVATQPSQIDPADAHQLFMPMKNLHSGLYTVVWRTVSAADGHPSQGSFAFGIGVIVANNSLSAIDDSVLPEGVAVRWLNLLSLSLVVGSIGFWLFVWQPAIADDYPVVRQRWYRLVWLGWLVTGLSSLLSFLLYVSTSADVPLIALQAVGNIITNTTFGHLWIARIFLWGLLGLMLWRGRGGKTALSLAIVCSALILITQSLFSHAIAVPDYAAVASDWLHLMSTALWVGGLVAFALVLFTLRREPDRTLLSERLVGAFSNYARVPVMLLLVTGLYAAWLEVGSLTSLLTTVYGQALLIKLLLLLPLLALAAINLIFTRRGLQAGERLWFGRLRGLVGAEITLALGILLAVGVMTSSNPARGIQAQRQAAVSPPQPQPYFAMELANNQMMHLEITPGYVGENEFIITPFDETGNLIEDASLIRLRFTSLDQNVGDSELRLKPNGQGEYRLKGSNLSLAGQWRIRMTVARPNKFDTVVDFNLTIGLSPPAPSFNMMSAVPGVTRTLAAALAGLALLGIGGFIAARSGRMLITAHGLLAVSGVVVGLIFLVIAAQGFPSNTIISSDVSSASPATIITFSGTLEPALPNPVQPDAASIHGGYTLYIQNCSMCHGPAGKGDGPVGLTLNPRPADLSVHTKPGIHPDGQLYEWITNGYPHSAMPAFGQRLSDIERWNLVNYIRTLTQK
ncbi:MAG: copper resistance protein CopC [Chloroflexota bacterium]